MKQFCKLLKLNGFNDDCEYFYFHERINSPTKVEDEEPLMSSKNILCDLIFSKVMSFDV